MALCQLAYCHMAQVDKENPETGAAFPRPLAASPRSDRGQSRPEDPGRACNTMVHSNVRIL